MKKKRLRREEEAMRVADARLHAAVKTAELGALRTALEDCAAQASAEAVVAARAARERLKRRQKKILMARTTRATNLRRMALQHSTSPPHFVILIHMTTTSTTDHDQQVGANVGSSKTMLKSPPGLKLSTQ